MTTDPLDILMPFYGDVALMQQAVRSILDQDDDGWRLTVVDDGTPGAVAEWFATLHDDRVGYVRNETNLGANANYRKALGLARGEHVVVMPNATSPDERGTPRAPWDDRLDPTHRATVAIHRARPENRGKTPQFLYNVPHASRRRPFVRARRCGSMLRMRTNMS